MAERPVECSHCKKTINVVYKEIAQSNTQCTEMCNDCPLLQQKLYSEKNSETSSETMKEGSELCCHHCRTSLEAIKMGSPLGCLECYAIFSDLLSTELFKLGKLSKNKKNHTPFLHLGKNPGQSTDIPPSSKITALNEALNEALNKENYEQAAWIRDQINALIEKKT